MQELHHQTPSLMLCLATFMYQNDFRVQPRHRTNPFFSVAGNVLSCSCNTLLHSLPTLLFDSHEFVALGIFVFVFNSLGCVYKMRLLSHPGVLCLAFWATAEVSSKAATQFYILTTGICVPLATSLATLVILHLAFSHLSGWSPFSVRYWFMFP